MPDDAIHERLRQAVAAGFGRQTEFLADLVRFPSVRGEEGPLQDWMARQFAGRGYSVDATRWTRSIWPTSRASAP